MKGGDLLEEDEVGEELLAAPPTPGEQLFSEEVADEAVESDDVDDSQISDSASQEGDVDALAVLDMVELRRESRMGELDATLEDAGENEKPYHTTRDGSDVAGQTPGTPDTNKNEVAASNPSSAYSQGLPSEHDNKIENVWIHWTSSDSDSAWQDDANRLGLKPDDDTPLSMQYQVEFDLSGQYDYEPGDIEFTIPASIWYDRDGNPVGYTTLSVPEDPDDGAEFAYRLIERGGEQFYLITNTRRMSATSKAMFQFSVRGITPHTVEDNIISTPIQTTVTVTTHDGTVIGFDSNVIDATIDTSEEVYRASKSGRLFEKSDEVPAELLANLPEGADPADYIYVRWYTYCYHRGNQEFELALEDTLTDPYHGVVLGVVGCDAAPSEDGRSVEASIFEGYHEDTAYIQDHIQYLWSAYPKTDPQTGEEQFPAGGVYDEFTNTAVWSLAEGDHEGDPDYVTTASADASVTYAPIKYTVIPGDFGLDKWTENIYKDYQYGYALSALRNGDPFDMNFRVRVVGKLWSWTLGEGLDPEDPASYGQRDIHFETEDYATYFNYDFEHELGPDDFEFVSVDVPAPAMYTWASGSGGAYGYRLNSDPSARPDVTLLVRRAGDSGYVEYAVIGYATGEPVVALTDAAVNDGVTVEGSRIVFPTERVDITDIKLSYTTHEAEIDLNYYPVVRLKPSARILEQVEQVYAASDEPTTKLRNDAKARITYADTGAEISDTDHVADDRLHNWYRSYATLDDAVLAVNSDKSLEYDPARDNDAAMRRITLHYTAYVYEQSNIRNRAMYDAAVEAGAIAEETSGVWYDLLPKGVVPDMASIALRESDSIRNAYTVENYKGSGRTLLVVEADLVPEPVCRTGSYGDVPTISFDAWYSWDSLKDYGSTLKNYVVFESGNEGVLGSKAGHQGEPDTPLGGMNYQSERAAGDMADVLADLDPATDDARFVYASAENTLSPDTSALTGLVKQVMDDSKGVWTQGLDGTPQVVVYPGHPYTYRLRVENDDETKARGIILYDTLENYHPTDQKADWGDKQWRGILRSVDVSQLEQMGAAPVVWYSTVPDLQFEEAADDMTAAERSALATSGAYELSGAGEGAWVKASEYAGSLADVTAIAVDVTKAADGGEFVLGENESLLVNIHMVAPTDETLLYGADGDGKDVIKDSLGEDGAVILGDPVWPDGEHPIFAAGESKYAAGGVNNRHAYNNTRMVCTQETQTGGTSENMFIRNDYTRVGIMPFVVEVEKVWNDGDDNDGRRPEVVEVELLADGQPAQKTDGTPLGAIELSEENGWSARIEHIKAVSDEVSYKPLTYSVVERAVPAGYAASIARSRTVDNGWVITNTHGLEKTQVSGVKTWVGDDGNADGTRPASITVALMADGEQVKTATVAPDTDGVWKYSFAGLPRYKNGHEIEYRVVELGEVPRYVADDAAGYNLVNRYYPYGELSFEKVVLDGGPRAERVRFPFTVLLFAEDGGEPLEGAYDYDVVSVDDSETVLRSGKVSSGGVIMLAHGERAVIHRLPAMSVYRLVEEELDGFTLASATGDTGVIKTDDQSHAGFSDACFTNTYASEGLIQLRAFKQLSGRALERNQFRFAAFENHDDAVAAIEDSDVAGMAVRVASCLADGSAGFGAIRISQADMVDDQGNRVDEKDFVYYIVELDYAKPGYTYDHGIYRAVVHAVDDGAGSISTSVAYYREGSEVSENVATFSNEYHATGGLSLRAWKVVEGRAVAEGEFEFELVRFSTNEDGAIVGSEVIATVTNASDGSIDFDPAEIEQLRFSEADAGKTCYFGVREMAGADPTVVYSDELFGWRVAVSDNGDGTLGFTQENVDGDALFANQTPDVTGELPIFTNHLKPGALSVTKHVEEGDPDNPDQEFRFRVELAGDGVDEDDRVREVALHAGETVTLDDIPAGTSYRVYEELPDGWVLVEQSGTSGIIEPLKTSEAVFTNRFQPDMAQAQLYALKTLDGQPAPEGSFTFELVDAATGEVIETVANGAGGYVQFSALEFVGDGSLGEHAYTIREVRGTDSTVIYDTHEETVLVTVSKDGGVMRASVAYDDDGAVFANATRPGELAVTKTTEGATAASADDGFEITVRFTNTQGQPVDPGTVNYYTTGSAHTAAPFIGSAAAASVLDWLGSLFAPKVAYAEGNGDFHVEEYLVDHPHAMDGNAYAILTTDGRLILFRSTATVEAGADKTIMIGGEELTGTVFAGVERTSATGAPWASSKDLITSVEIAEGQAIKPANLANWFSDCTNLTTVDLARLDTSQVQSMSNTFSGCSNLTEIRGIESWDTSRVRTMANMFNGCASLVELDVSHFKTGRLSGQSAVSSMFEGCTSLTALDLSGWDVSRLTYTLNMFKDCASLERLDLSGWNTAGLRNVSGMFEGAGQLKEIKLGPLFKFKSNSAGLTSSPLPDYTGNWVKADDPSLSLTADELMTRYDTSDGAMAGTWIWEIAETYYQVRFDANGGITTAQSVLTDDAAALVSLPDAETTVRPRYLLTGWNTKADGSGASFEPGEVRAISEMCTPGQTVTLYAQWEGPCETYIMETYEQNSSGTGYDLVSSAQGMAPAGAMVSMDAMPPEGFFLSTEHEQELSGAVLVNPSMLTLRAYFDRIRYALVFDANAEGASGAMPAMSLVGGIAAMLPYNRFQNGDEHFIGWNTESDGSGTAYVDGAQVLNLATENGQTVTLYAQWTGLDPAEPASSTGEYTVMIHGGETVHFVNMPAGTTYEVVESTIPAGWTQVGSSGTSGVIPAAGTAEAGFVNRYDASGWFAPAAAKVIEGGTLANGQFSFRLCDELGNVLQVQGNGMPDDHGMGLVNFEPIDYTLAGVRADAESGACVFDEAAGTWTYTYTISEVAGEDGAVIYDSRVEAVTVTVRDAGAGKLEVAGVYSGELELVDSGKRGADGEPLMVPAFENSIKPGELVVTKTVTGATEVEDDVAFPFAVAFTDADGKPLADATLAVLGVEGISSITTDDAGVAELSIRAGETAVIAGVPHGASYAIEEGRVAGFSQVAVTGATGTITANQLSEASFENAYAATGSIVLEAEKTLVLETGGMRAKQGILDGQFLFELRDDDGEPLEIVSNDKDGRVVFSTLHYSEADHGQTFTYYIREIAGTDSTIAYDAHEEQVLVTVTDAGDGTLDVAAEYVPVDTDDTDGKATFENETTVPIVMPASGQGGIPVVSAAAGIAVLIASLVTLFKRRREGLAAVLVVGLLTAGATGMASVVSQDGSIHTYDAYQLLAGDVHDGVLVDASLNGCMNPEAFASLGAPSEAQYIAEWLADGAASDDDGTFTASIADAVQASGAMPAATFSSGEVVQLAEGYWVIVSEDARPMLWLIDDAEPVEAVEKSTVPSQEIYVGDPKVPPNGPPGTGDPTSFTSVAGLVLIAVSVLIPAAAARRRAGWDR